MTKSYPTAGSGTAISAEVCTVFALSLQRVGGNLAMQWFGHTGRVLSLPFCQVDCSNVLQQCRIPTMFSWSFDNNIAPCQVCCIIPLDNMLHTKYKAICQPDVLTPEIVLSFLEKNDNSMKTVLRSTRVQRQWCKVKNGMLPVAGARPQVEVSVLKNPLLLNSIQTKKGERKNESTSSSTP